MCTPCKSVRVFVNLNQNEQQGFVHVGFCHGGVLSRWGFVQVGFYSGWILSRLGFVQVRFCLATILHFYMDLCEVHNPGVKAKRVPSAFELRSR